MFAKLFRKKVLVAPTPDMARVLEVLQTHNPQAVDERKWCVHAGEVGIAHKIHGANVEFHVVDQTTRETTSVRSVPYVSLRLARYEEIPKQSRPASAAVAAVRGYI